MFVGACLEVGDRQAGTNDKPARALAESRLEATEPGLQNTVCQLSGNSCKLDWVGFIPERRARRERLVDAHEHHVIHIHIALTSLVTD